MDMNKFFFQKFSYIYFQLNKEDMNKHQVEKPSDIWTDHRGRALEVGTTVAYNCSGAVDIGVITEIVSNTWKKSRRGVDDKWWWTPDFYIKVYREHKNRVSHVRNPQSFVVI